MKVTIVEHEQKEQREVSIWDVIKECEGVTDREVLNTIISRYEYTTDYGTTYELNENLYYLDNPIGFVTHNNYQLRLKEVK